MDIKTKDSTSLIEDQRFKRAVELFNSCEWYLAHDAFEELWHESDLSYRITLQGFLQVAVAQLHLERGNNKGATILFGEALGRLRTAGIDDLGIDIENLCFCLEKLLKSLQNNLNTDMPILPSLLNRS